MDQAHLELRSLIDRIRRRWFRLVALRTAGRATAAAAIPICAALVVDRVLTPEGALLVLLAVATLLGALGLAAVVLWRMPPRPDDPHVARFIEERATAVPECGPMDDALVTAVEVAGGPAGPEWAPFVPLIIGTGVQRLRAVDPACLISARSLRRAAAEAAAGSALFAAALSVGAGGFTRAFETAMLRLFPESVRVEVLPGDARVPEGTPLRIRAHVRGRAGSLIKVAPSLTVSSGDSERTVAMTRAGDTYEYVFASINRTFSYHVAAGTARSSDYTVTALFPPRVDRIDLHYAYPAFAGLAPRDEEDGGDIYAPAGTRVRLRIRTDKPIARGALAIAGDSPVALRTAGDRTYDADLVLARDGSYRVQLADADGLRSAGETEYFIRLMDDRPPDVRILRPSSDQHITPLEEVAIEARADDDYGIARFDLVYAVAGGEEKVVPFDRVSGTGVQKVGSRLLPAEDLGVKPGDVIAYYARARDVGRGKRSTETRSDLFFLEVKPFDEQFVAAQSQAGQGMSAAAGAQLESLIEAQKEIISATWNIERRSEAGRSVRDVKTIAQAQTELKTRVEALSSRSGRRGPSPALQRPAPQAPQRGSRPSGTPIAAAIAAMTKAIAQLETARTKDALAHEMAALTGLLEAQAEVRRRQISQQANGAGSGGSNRAGQDLSALFDKELQRQQKTNYENRSQIEEREQSSDAALDRIRDLARRQEDLGRRQQELAKGGMTPEEMKRQLEKLTREQMQLRQDADDLARQTSHEGQQESSSRGQRGGAAGVAGQAGESSPGEQARTSAGGGLREAGEQMRSAANELRRDDPEAAAQAAQRAAQQLRNVEQQMRGGAAEGKQRASGNLQMEAQQIAQEHRRIGSEAERLDQGRGGASAEARRRLADEQERLAGRVDELQRAALRVGQGEAATRELQREKIGERMRESAKRMREQGPGADSAETEQQIARALDRVVGALGGAGSARTKQLTDQLAQTREIRDRLNRIEQQMREASTNGGKGPPRQDGPQGSRGASAGGQGGSGLQQLQQEYQRELARARDAIGKLGKGGEARPRSGSGMATPEQEEFSRSAPGTEAFKQDKSGWASLRQDIDMALEKAEAAASDRLARGRTGDRFSGGGSDRVPERYTRLIAKYYESIAKVKK